MEHVGTTFWEKKKEKDPRIMICETIPLTKVICCHHHPTNYKSDIISLLFTRVSILPS